MWVDVINTYAGSPLNRLNNERKEVDLFVRVEASPKAVCVVFDGRYQVLASKEGCLAWIERDRLWEKLTGAGVEENSVTEAFLGEWDRMEDGVWTCFAVQVASGLNGMFDELYPEAKFVNLRAMSVSKNISMEELAVAAHGKALMEFHRRHRFCGLCGAETVAEEGATKRRCQRNIAGENARHDVPGTCPGMWFPRTDPVVICVVVDGNRCLLGRKKEWPHGVYSALAGFMEHGESCEDAVRREVFEEAGIQVGRCRYHSSQPWPFPYSLMIGFLGEALTTTIRVDEHELETAKWFPLEDVQAMLINKEGSGQNRTPPPMAIAHQLVASFARQDPVATFRP